MENEIIAIYPGCLVSSRFPEYELSARQILKKLKVAIQNVPNFSCCGSQLAESIDNRELLLFSARNLAVAQAKGVQKILTLCGSCTNELTRARKMLQDPESLAFVNELLKASKLEILADSIPQVIHLAKFLTEEKIWLQIQSNITSTLAINVGLQVPCMATRPPELYGESGTTTGGDFAEILEDMIRLAGAHLVDFEYKNRCCGGTMLAFDEKVGKELGKVRYNALRESKADLIITACPNCQLVYSIYPPLTLDEKQNIGEESKIPKTIPAIFFTQLLGLALGLSPKALGIDRNPDWNQIQRFLTPNH